MAAGAGWRAQAAKHARGRRLARQVEGGRGLRAEHGVRMVRLTEASTVRMGDDVLLAHDVQLHLRDRVQAVVFAYEVGLIRPTESGSHPHG